MVRLNLRKEIQSSPQLAVHIVTMALTYAFVG